MKLQHSDNFSYNAIHIAAIKNIIAQISAQKSTNPKTYQINIGRESSQL